MSLLCRPLKSAGRRPPRTTKVLDVGDAVRTQRSDGQPEYEPIRAACNRLAQLSTCTYLLQRRCDSGERRVRSTYTFAARGTLLRVRISSILIQLPGDINRDTHAQCGASRSVSVR